MKAKNIALAIVIITAVVIVAAILKTYPWAKEEVSEIKDEAQASSDTSKSELELSNLSTANYTYSLEEIPWNTNTGFIGQKLVRENKSTGEKETVVENVKDRIPELSVEDSAGLVLTAQPENTNKIFFSKAILFTDGGVTDLFSYDIVEENFAELDSSSVFDRAGFYEVSPDQLHLFLISNKNHEGLDQTLYVFDLLNDTYETLKLENNETFNSGRYAMGADWDAAWIDNDTVQYAVYDQSKKSDPGYNSEDETSRQSTFIEYREFKID